MAEFTSALSSYVSQISKLTAMTTKWTVPKEEGTNKDDSKADEDCGNPMLACQECVPKKAKNWPNARSTLSAFHMTRLANDTWCYITDLSSKINSTGETTLELDSLTNTCVLGVDAWIFLDYEWLVIVEG
jgi:hypothetical protein